MRVAELGYDGTNRTLTVLLEPRSLQVALRAG